MQFVKCVLILCISFQLISDALTLLNESPPSPPPLLSSSSLPLHGYGDDGDDDIPIVHHFHADPELRGFERTMLRDMAEDEPEYFNEKEQRVRDALLRSTQDVRSQRTLYDMLPILRSLSREQRLTLAALIATQTSHGKSAKSLDLDQVCKRNKTHFVNFSLCFCCCSGFPLISDWFDVSFFYFIFFLLFEKKNNTGQCWASLAFHLNRK